MARRGGTTSATRAGSGQQLQLTEALAPELNDTEPLPPGHPLWDAPNVTVTAHMSADAVGWREALADGFATNARRWLAGEPLLNVVDKKLGYVPAGATA